MAKLKALRSLAPGFAFILILSGFSLTGCGSKEPVTLGASTVSWFHGADGRKDPLPGIDDANVNLGIWDDGAALVIWDDARFSGLGARGMAAVDLKPGETRKGVRYEGHSGNLDIECYTADGTNGTVKIGVQIFDLARGALFLVSTTGQKAVVKQLTLAKLNLKPQGNLSCQQVTSERMQAVANTDQDIRTFFAEAAKPK